MAQQKTNDVASEESTDVVWLAEAMERNPILADIARQHSEMIFVAIMACERERALQIVSRAFETIDENHATAESHVCVVAGNRAGAILEKNAGIRTIGQLCKRTISQVLAIRGIDYNSLRQIITNLEKYGFALKK
jgi:DNA-directed RNA polymerase alpha subunit